MPWQGFEPRGWGDRVGGWGPPGRRQRPPWWPENEPWPPEGPEAWRRLRRGFMRRALGFVVAALVLFAALLAAVIWLLALAGVGVQSILAGVLVMLIPLLALRWIVRGFRYAAAPVGELIEASGRVEAGQLGIQVPERGPREVRALTRSFNAMSARLERTEQQRRRLLADVSHELRTPLTVIQGNVEAMLDGLYPADREHLERIQSEAAHLERLIEDLRTLSLADVGALGLEREPVDLADLARGIADGFRAQADGAGVTIVVDAQAPVDAELDAHRTRQVIGNLVANALRHTPAGGRVTVSVRSTQESITLDVADTGSGMAAEDAARAFDRFWKAGESAGAGLGLAIVRDLVRAHGGEVTLRSVPGEGTMVTCTFPMPGGVSSGT